MRTKFTVLILFFTASLMAQDYESFFEEFDVVLHQLQVNVLDRDGNPVRGLTKGDFEVRLNGQSQQIETIEEFSLESIVEKADQESVEIPEQARRLFVFLFDLRYSTKRGVLEAQKSARDFVMSEMLPTDLAGVFTYSQLAGVSMVTNFTGDSNHLLSSIDTLGLGDTKNVITASGYLLDSVIQDSLALSGFNSQGQLTNAPGNSRFGQNELASQFLEQILRKAQTVERRNYQREVLGFLASMEKFADGLRFIRGRKNMVWFSTGFDASSLVGLSFEELRRNSRSAMLGELEDVSVDQFGSGDVQNASLKAVTALQASGTVIFALDTSLVDESTEDKSGLHTLNFFAKDTGGRVFYNTNDFDEPLEEVKEITNHYYLVSFYPETKRKDRDGVGKIRVKVNKPRVDVYTNRGILLDPDFKNMSQIEKNIQLSEYMARDQIIRGLPISVNTVPMPTDSRFTKLSVNVQFRGDYFLAPGIRNTPREVEVYTMAIDPEKDVVFDQSYFQFRVEPKRIEQVLDKSGLMYFANLFVDPGTYKLKIVARDLENGKIGSWIQNIDVPDRNNLQFSGPVVLSDQQWVMLRQPEEIERQLKAGNLDFSYPFQIGNKALVPHNAPIIPGKGEAKLFYVLNYRESSGNQKLPSIQMMFMDENNKYITIPPDAVKAETELRPDEPHLTSVAITIDMSKVNVTEGQTYKLMAYFGLEGQEAIKSMSEITVASL